MNHAIRIRWPDYSHCIKDEEMPHVMRQFESWWSKARPHVSDEVKEMAHMALTWCFRPIHMFLIVNTVAAAYRELYEQSTSTDNE